MKKEDKVLIVILLNENILNSDLNLYLNNINKHSYRNVECRAFYFDKSYIKNNNFVKFSKKIKTEYIKDFTYAKLLKKIGEIAFSYVYFAHYGEYLSIDAIRLCIQSENVFDIGAFDIINSGFYYNLSPLQNADDIIKDNLLDFYKNVGVFYNAYANISYKLYSNKLIKKIDASHIIDDYTWSYQIYKNATKMLNIKSGFAFCNYGDYTSHCINFNKKEYEKKLSVLLSESKDANFLQVLLFGATKISNVNNNFLNILLRQYENSFVKTGIRKENYFQHLEKVEDSFYGYEKIKEKICSDNVKIVSFDIFDTLILRPFLKPTDLFCFLDFKFNELYNDINFMYFSKIRQKAEEECRRLNNIPGIEEITLEAIYKYIAQKYSFNKKIVDELMNYEQELEYEFCVARRSGKELYSLALYLEKKVICLSDIYLNYTLIKRILEKNGYSQISDLRLSSKSKKLKCTGSSFALLKSEYEDYSSILHIGDNYSTDVEMAIKCGIDAMHIPNVANCAQNSAWYSKVYSSDDNFDYHNSNDFLGNRIAIGLIVNKIYDYPFLNNAYDTDYGMSLKQVGSIPLALGVLGNCVDIYNLSVSNNYRKNVFLARDGYLLYNAYKILYPNENTDYLYTSRKVLLPISIHNKLDFYSFLYSNQNIPLSPERIFDILGNHLKINRSDYLKVVTQNGYNYLKYLSEEETLAFLNIIAQYFDNKKSSNYLLSAQKYYSDIIPMNSVLIDIGYSGRAESIFTDLLGYPVNSIYIHSKLSLPYDRARKSKFKVDTILSNFPKISGSIREYIYSSTEPSCIAIDYAKKKPVLDKKNIDMTESFVVNCIQNNAIGLIKNYHDTFKNYFKYLLFDSKSLEKPLEDYFYSPKIKDAHIFDIASFEDKINILNCDYVNMFDIWMMSIERYKYIDKTVRDYPLTDSKPQNKEPFSFIRIIKTIIKKAFYPFYRVYKNKIGNIVTERLDENNAIMNSQFQSLRNENEQLRNLVSSLDKKIDYLMYNKDGD